jgi:hypothetical protein
MPRRTPTPYSTPPTPQSTSTIPCRMNHPLRVNRIDPPKEQEPRTDKQHRRGKRDYMDA